MKILLLGNYENNRQQSMERFAEMMREGLTVAGHEVRLARPSVVFGRLHHAESGLGKWIGYIDRFLLYPLRLRRQACWADIVHICDQTNAVYIPHLGGKPHVLTCHDMLAIRAAFGEIAESPTGWTGRIYQRWILRNLRKAQLVVCVSRQTGEDLQRLAGLSGGRTIIVPNALNYPYCPMAAKESGPQLSELGLLPGRPFFFHVGNNSWYKNRLGVLRIFAEVVKRPGFELHSLVMAGKPWTAEMRQLVHDLGLQERAVELVNVSNEALRALYSAAEALLFPSLAEGFGWPIIEAQACGCPVVTTDLAPMTVVGGAGAVYIAPGDVAGSAGTIASALGNRGALIQLGLRNAERFSSGQMINSYIDAYRTVLELERGSVVST